MGVLSQVGIWHRQSAKNIPEKLEMRYKFDSLVIIDRAGDESIGSLRPMTNHKNRKQ